MQLAPEQIDVVTLHIHEQGLETPVAMVVQRVSLTQAVLMNWQGESNNDIFGDLLHAPWAGTLPEGSLQIVETLPAPPLLHNGAWYRVFNGLFRRTEDGRLDHSTLLGLSAETLQSHIEAMDYHAQYKALLDGYWQDHLASHRLSCKLNFIAACNRQVGEGSLSDAARKLIWRACDLLPRGDRLRLSTLSIYGYAATDLLYINDAISDMTVLYVPGNSSPLLEFASETALKDWIGTQCKDPAKRQALKQHFRLADGPRASTSVGWTPPWKAWAPTLLRTLCHPNTAFSMMMVSGRRAITSTTGQPGTTRKSPATSSRPWPNGNASAATTMPISSSPATVKSVKPSGAITSTPP